MRKVFVALAIFLLPSITFAAGFAKQNIFLSTDSPTEGDSVVIYVVLSNDTAQPFTGLLKMYDEVGTIGTTSVTLAAGNAETASIPWRPEAGVHSLNATLTTLDGTSILESENATFTIAAKPQAQPSNSSSAFSNSSNNNSTVQSSQPIQQSIANVSPSAARDSEPVFTVIDTARTAVANTLRQGSSWATNQVAQKPTFISSTTPGASIIGGSWNIGATTIAWVLDALRYGVGHIGIFYPAVALLFFFILWRLWRRMRRPKYRY